MSGVSGKVLALLPLLASAAVTAQNQADAYYDPAAMAQARERVRHHNGGQSQYLILGERLESRLHDGEAGWLWEGQGWIGPDLKRLWIKTEGEQGAESGDLEQAELQLLYSQAISPYFDLQAGLRHDFEPHPTRNYLALGIQGLAPQWFELGAALFLSEHGDLGSRLEAEYDLRLTQRLILQPRLELNHAFSADSETGVGQGLNNAEFGLRLRYEFRREFAPYLGIGWERAFGDSADLLRDAGESREELSFLMGIRFWY